MNFIQDLSTFGADRIFVIGDILGDYDKLINVLYQQRFNFKDILITTGNFINAIMGMSPANVRQLDAILFLKNVITAYSVKGKNEFDFLRKMVDNKEEDPETSPDWLKNSPNREEILKFIEELPLIIKISDYIYIVNAGIQPEIPIEKQDPEVFYSIGEYDPDSRFYQFNNPDKKSWYDFDMPNNLQICFGGKRLDKIEYPAGYCLGREIGMPMRVLIFRKDQDRPILIEA